MATPSSSPRTVKFAPLPASDRLDMGGSIANSDRLSRGGSLYQLGATGGVDPLSSRRDELTSMRQSTSGINSSTNGPLAASTRRFNLSVMDDSIASSRAAATPITNNTSASNVSAPVSTSYGFSTQRKGSSMTGVPARASLLRGSEDGPQAAGVPPKVAAPVAFSSVPTLGNIASISSAAGRGVSRLLLRDEQMDRAVQIIGAPAGEHDGLIVLLRHMCGPIEMHHTVRTKVQNEVAPTVFGVGPAPTKKSTAASVVVTTTTADAASVEPSLGIDVLGSIYKAITPFLPITTITSEESARRQIPWRKETVSLNSLSERARPINVIFDTNEAALTALSLTGTLEHNGRRLGVVKLANVNNGSMFFFDYDDDCYIRPSSIKGVAGADVTLAKPVNRRLTAAGKIRAREEDEEAIAALTATTKILRSEADVAATHTAIVAQLGGTRLPTAPICRVRFPRLMALPLAEYWLLPFIRTEPRVEDCDPWRATIYSTASTIAPEAVIGTK